MNAPGPVPTTSPESEPRARVRRREDVADPGQQVLAVAMPGLPGRDGDGRAVGLAERDDRPRRRRVEREHPAAAAAPALMSQPRTQPRRRPDVPAVPLVGGADRQGPGLVRRAGDPDLEPRRRQRVTHPLRPLDQGHAARLAVVDQAAGDGVTRVPQPVEVLVEQVEPAVVLGHEDEARGVDRVVDAEAGPEPLRQLRLAGAEVAGQRDDVAGLRDARERGAEALGRVGIAGDDGHSRDRCGWPTCPECTRGAPAPRAGVRRTARGRTAGPRWVAPRRTARGLPRGGRRPGSGGCPAGPTQRPSRPPHGPCRDADPVGCGHRDRDVAGVEQEERRVAGDGHVAPDQR